jgi:hypothetical protein
MNGMRKLRLRAGRLAAGVALAALGAASQAAIVGQAGLEKVFGFTETGYILPGTANLQFQSVVAGLDPITGNTQVNGQVLGLGAEVTGQLALDAVVDATTGWLACDCGFAAWDHDYLGFSFEDSDGTHYGWLRISVPGDFGPFVIHDYAYEDVAGAAIRVGQFAVPEPGSLALLLGGGVAALLARRRKAASQA